MKKVLIYLFIIKKFLKIIMGTFLIFPYTFLFFGIFNYFYNLFIICCYLCFRTFYTLNMYNKMKITIIPKINKKWNNSRYEINGYIVYHLFT